MDAAEVLGEFRRPEDWRVRCSVSKFITSLSDRDREFFNAALRMNEIRPFELQAWAKDHGWGGSDATIVRHRLGIEGTGKGCACRE